MTTVKFDYNFLLLLSRLSSRNSFMSQGQRDACNINLIFVRIAREKSHCATHYGYKLLANCLGRNTTALTT